MADFVAAVRGRANELHARGLTPRRALRVLRAEFPHVERDTLVNAARMPGYRKGVNPRWTEWGQPLRPTQIRYQIKQRDTEEPVKIRTLQPRKGRWLTDD